MYYITVPYFRETPCRSGAALRPGTSCIVGDVSGTGPLAFGPTYLTHLKLQVPPGDYTGA